MDSQYTEDPSGTLSPRQRCLCSSCDEPDVSVVLVFRFKLFTFYDDVDGLSMDVALSAAVATVEVDILSAAAGVVEVEVDGPCVGAWSTTVAGWATSANPERRS